VWQEVNDLGYMVRCVSCGAHFSMTEDEYGDPGLPMEAARRHGLGGTCDEEEVRRVMES